MRHPITITMDHETWAEFQEECGLLRLTPSREIEQLVLTWLKERERAKVRKIGRQRN